MNSQLRLVNNPSRRKQGIWERYPTVDPAPAVVGVGLVSLDIVYGMDRNCGPQLTAGGTCGNVLTALAFLGWRSYPLSRLAGDKVGEHVKGDLNRWGVQLDYASTPPVAGSPIIIETIRTDPRGAVVHRFSSTCPSCGKRFPPYAPVLRRSVAELAPRLTAQAVLFVDRLSAGAVMLAEEARKHGSLIYFEPSANSGRHLLSKMLNMAHILKYSRDRARNLPLLRGRVPRVPLEIETLGNRGLRYRGTMFGATGRRWRNLPPFTIPELRDASGAGDWCSAGIIHALGQAGWEGFVGLPRDLVEEGLSLGQAFGAWTCAFEGARGGMYLMQPGEISSYIVQLVEQRRASQSPVPNYCVLPFDVFGELCKTCGKAQVGPAALSRSRRRASKRRAQSQTA